VVAAAAMIVPQAATQEQVVPVVAATVHEQVPDRTQQQTLVPVAAAAV
jgi:hypothetical protein